MKIIIVLTLLGFCWAQLNTYAEFKAANSGKSVTEYAVELGFKSFELEFNKFKIDNNRNYGSEEEEENRKFNFLKTLQFIEKHNELYKRGEVTHEVGVSLFADRTREEYENSFSMPDPLKMNVTQVSYYEEPIVPGLPASFDWRAQGKVTEVKNQGGCGSCWAFTTAAVIESGYLIHHNQRVSLSEQQMVDCLNTNCGGLYIDRALAYVQQNGLEAEGDYPYQARASACRNNAGRFHARINGYHNMCRAAGRAPCSDEEIMNEVMTRGPVGFMLDASGDDFGHYRGGVLSTGINQWKAVHAMTIVGWGPDHWIIKNSWGPGWGEGGFLRLARGRNMRGINEYVYGANF